MDINSLAKQFEHQNSDFRPFIESIHFFNYKNIKNGEELTFDFPLTVLIGKNGTNKSSILHALYGCPNNYSTGEYWFSTHLDPLNISKARAEYFYRYTHPITSENCEVLHQRIKRSGEPDYWEPSRPKLELGMKRFEKTSSREKLPDRSGTRWNTMEKNVEYLDFRSELTAFDKAFYKNNQGKEAFKENKDRIRRGSKALKDTIENHLDFKEFQTKNRVIKNYHFTSDEIEIVNSILDTEYKDIIYVEHNFYHSGGYSIYIKKDALDETYSEAWAGSGESSIIRLVYAIEKAPKKSLILLDEPETSLHISAQKNLQKYILKTIQDNHHQVVISTHSPHFTDDLPFNAIKTLHIDEEFKQVLIGNSALPGTESFFLGHITKKSDKALIIVEDKLAKEITLKALKTLDSNLQDKLRIEYYPGGKSQMYKMAEYDSIKETNSTYYLFDGDQKPTNTLPKSDSIAPNQLGNLSVLLGSVYEEYKNINNIADSGSSIQLKSKHYLSLIEYTHQYFKFLPFPTPEEFICRHSDVEIDESEISKKDYFKELLKNKAIIKYQDENITSEQIFHFQQILIAEIQKELLEDIGEILKLILNETTS